MTIYPAQIDTSQSLPIVVDNLTPVSATIANGLRSSIIAIEQTLGVNPAGNYGSMAARISNIEATITNLQTISLAQDLGGTPTNPLVIGIQGRPVSSAQPALQQILLWNGVAWGPANITTLTIPTTTNSRMAGGASALPATPAGYAEIYINGILRYLPYY